MTKYIFTNIIGSFVFDKDFKVVDKIEFKNLEEYNDKLKIEEKLSEKHSPTLITKQLINKKNKEILRKILAQFKDQQNFSNFYKQNIIITAKQLKESVNEDNFIVQTINNIEEIDKVANTLTKRLREWYELHCPEFSRSIESHEKFTELILNKSKKDLLKEVNLDPDNSIGADLKDKDIIPMINLANGIHKLYDLKKKHTKYLDDLMEKYCKNIKTIAGTLIAAKLIEHAKSLRSLAKMPSSTVQIIGAEKALFRHLKTNARPPKHGLIINHPLVTKSRPKTRGRTARHLANKIALAAKVDYNKGEFIADKLMKKLEKELK
jgi:nucleolar protein 56